MPHDIIVPFTLIQEQYAVLSHFSLLQFVAFEIIILMP